MIEHTEEGASREFLKNHKLGRLGMVLEDGQPYVVPVNYLFKDDGIYIHSLPGKKVSAMKANGQVCLQTDEISSLGFEWQSVIAFGKFEEVLDRKKKIRILKDFYKAFPHFTPVEAMFDDGEEIENIVVFFINIDRLTGVSENY